MQSTVGASESAELAPEGSRTPEATPQAATDATSGHREAAEAHALNAGPATELRAAAAKLRKHIKHATDGPWITSSVWSPDAASTSAVYSHAHPTGTVDSEVVASGRIRSGYGGIRNPWNAEYIALMQPSVGVAIAELLEVEADVVDEIRRQSPDLTDDQLAAQVHGALAIARALNSQEASR